MRAFQYIGFDADDTLWHSEDGFERAKDRFLELVQPHVADPSMVATELLKTERRNLPTFGYGVRSFGLSMIETAVLLSEGSVPAPVIGELVAMTREHLQEPVRVLPGVVDTLNRIAKHYPIMLITKGDLLHQTSKVASSGLADLFTHIEIFLEKDDDTYRNAFRRLDVDPTRFCMVGNSVRSDILPVLSLGGQGVHLPYHLLWELEAHEAEHDPTSHERFVALTSIEELPEWLGI